MAGETYPPGQGRLLELYKLLSQFNPDEIEAFHFIAERHAVGRAKYGPLDLRSDDRDFEREGGEELSDWLSYTAFDRVRAMIKARR